MPAAVLAAVVAFAAAGFDAGASANGAPGPPAPDSAAAADIQAAHLQLLARRQLDVARFAGLLSDAHRLSPALDPRAAAEWRQAAILLVGLVPRDSCSRFVDAAVALDPGLALDDTLGAIADLLGGPPPGMRAQLAARGAKAPGGHASSAASRKPFPEGALRPSDSPNLSPNVRRADPAFFPRLLQTGAVADPRGPNARYQVVMVSAVIGVDGRIREVKDAFGADELKAAAKAAVGGWTFAPMTVYGHPVEATTGIPVEFGKPPPPPSPPPPPPAAVSGGDALPKYDHFVYVEVLPEAIHRVQAQYPDLAREAGVDGTVLLQALVDSTGHGADVRVVRSIPMLDAAAVVRQWVFRPATSYGRPVAMWTPVPVKFEVSH